ncbi:MAG: hypothetical protein JXA89_02640 [Anaerolineae bacterium]|nr:hypothetical protein [Anaerolineae bacterium]
MQNKLTDHLPLIWTGLSVCLALILLIALWIGLTFFALSPAVRAQGTIIYVDQDAPGPQHDGSSWTTAYLDLQEALATATSGIEIWVAEGVYTPGPAGTLTATFQLTNDVALYGGFGGYGISETQRTQRDWENYITVLSGDLGRDDDTEANGVLTDTTRRAGENAYHVVTSHWTDYTTVLDGFTITAGYAGVYDHDDGNGGGMSNIDGGPTLVNLTFSGNEATGTGGGMHNRWYSNPTLTNIIFIGNRAKHGGGMSVSDKCISSLTNVIFRDNYAQENGGGMFSTWQSTSTLISVVFDGNRAEAKGGGIHTWGSVFELTGAAFDSNQAALGGGMWIEGSNCTLTAVTLNSNQASWSGGGIHNKGGNATLANVIFEGNQSIAGSGGGMSSDSRASASLRNVLFSGNRASGEGGGMYSINDSNLALVNVTVSGNWASIRGGGVYNGSSNPTLVNCIVWGNGAPTGPEIFNEGTSIPTVAYSDVQWASGVYTGTGNLNVNPLFVDPIDAIAAPTIEGNYRLQSTSPAIDAGHNDSVTAATDLDGNPRRVDVPWIADTGNGMVPLVDMGAYEYKGYRIFLPIVFRNYP